MKRVTIKIGDRQEMLDRVREAVRTRKPQGSFVAFDNYDVFARTMTGNRLRLLNLLINENKGLTVRAIAKRLGRNLRGVHEDIKTLAHYELVINERGNIHVPYDDVHIDVHIRRAA